MSGNYQTMETLVGGGILPLPLPLTNEQYNWVKKSFVCGLF